MAIQGIGRLVSQYVHERNAARAANRTAPEAGDAGVMTHPAPVADSAEFSAEALARFEAWKARHAAAPDGAPSALPVTPLPAAPVTVTD